MTRLAILVALASIAVVPLAADPAAGPHCPPADDDVRGLLACGEQAIDRGKLKAARTLLDRAIELTGDMAPDDPLVRRVVHQRARVESERRDPDARTEVFRAALARLDARPDASPAARVWPLIDLADSMAISESPEAALGPAEAAVEIAEAYVDDEGGRRRLAKALTRLGGLQERAAAPDAAAVTYRRVADLYGWEPHIDLLGAIEPLARLEYDAGRVDDARRAYVTAILSYLSARGADNRTLHELIDELATLGEWAEREDVVAQAERLRARVEAVHERLDSPAPRTGRVHAFGEEGVTQPRRRSYVPPEYPEEARVKRAEGRVTMQIVVLPDGTVGAVEIVQCSNPGVGFEEAATRAVRQWTFDPAVKEGVAVASYFVVQSAFTLN